MENNDTRIPCKYGSSCYQKNKNHHEKYKHPQSLSKDEDETNSTGTELPAKKFKPNSVVGTNSPAKNKNHSNNITPRNITIDVKTPESDCTPASQVLLRDKPRTECSKLLELKSDFKELIKQLFLVEMPADFYSFWELCQSLSTSEPSNAFKAIKLKLVGPFDVLLGKINNGNVYEEDLPDLLRHWRFYYDPPEFQTVIVKEGSSCFHLGYYRDDPKEMPVFVASNELNSKSPEKNGDIKIVGDNLFAALNSYLDELKTDPFSRMKVPKFQKCITSWAEEKGFSLTKGSRKRNVVVKTFHGAGIVVPLDKKNDIGYRELAASNTMIKKILKGIVDSKTEEERKPFWEQLQPIITFANIANDECDFGTSLELGLDLFTYGSPLLHRTARQLLTTAYNLLGRTQFAQIVQAHLENRRHGNNLSVL